jgi:hypothetical protein
MGEVSLGHEVVCLDHLLDILTVNTDSHSHNHVLRSLDNLAVDPQ